MIRHSSSTGAPLSTWMPRSSARSRKSSSTRIAAALQLHGVARDSLLTGAAKKNHDGNSYHGHPLKSGKDLIVSPDDAISIEPLTRQPPRPM